jgi:hypothetical protein
MTQQEQAEVVRIRAVYRRLVLLGRVRLPPALARRLLGPDLAYRLSSGQPDGSGPAAAARARRKAAGLIAGKR